VKAEGVEVLREKVFDATRHTPGSKAPVMIRIERAKAEALAYLEATA
jgi:hypothetical protein